MVSTMLKLFGMSTLAALLLLLLLPRATAQDFDLFGMQVLGKNFGQGPFPDPGDRCWTNNCKGNKVCCPEYWCNPDNNDNCELIPSTQPSVTPTDRPTKTPTQSPTLDPTQAPSRLPTSTPSKTPTQAPTTENPTGPPTRMPSDNPTGSPSKIPTEQPTTSPSKIPTASPTGPPTLSSDCSHATYLPGELNVACDGLLLSQGLWCRRIATTGQRVQYGNGGGESSIAFHDQPDAGACFATSNGGWIYTSNAEVWGGNGGVGAITFDADGEITNYKMILTGTSVNCGGGRTSWGTWISCEEHGGIGEVYETYPDGSPPQLTKLGEPKGTFESAAQDDDFCFYVTNDSHQGELRRYCPDRSVVEDAKSSGDYSNVLTSDGGTMHYLILSANADSGTFTWSTDVEEGRLAAQQRGYPFAEGIDYRKGRIYFVTKTTKRLFILDLAAQTFERFNTNSGAFNNQPDQIKFIVGDDVNNILYFCEDGGADCGVHGRDNTAQFFTILDGPAYHTETTGLAFNPTATKMYVSFQGPGHIFEIWRTDGCPFTGTVLDIKYHEA